MTRTHAMTDKVLRIDSSVNLTGSTSRAMADRLITALAPGSVQTRDLAADPLPQINAAWTKARLVATDAQTDADKDILNDYVTNNAIKLHVYFNDKTIVEITEEEEYSFSSLVSTIGGVVSLYLGLSLISMFECLEIVLRKLCISKR